MSKVETHKCYEIYKHMKQRTIISQGTKREGTLEERNQSAKMLI